MPENSMTDEAKMPDEIWAMKTGAGYGDYVAPYMGAQRTKYIRADKAVKAGELDYAMKTIKSALTPPDNAELVKVRDFLNKILEEQSDLGKKRRASTITTWAARDALAILDSMMKREG